MALAVDKDYASYQDIREEAGQQAVSKLDTLSGVIDGSNASFYAKRTYIVDRDYDDAIGTGSGATDVIVYDDDVAVTVSTVNQATGEIVLASAPALGSSLLVTFAHSALSDTLVDKRRKEAIGYAKRRLNGVIDYSVWEASDVPETLKTFTRLYTAGLLLIQDQGLNVDTEETSKDGYKKLSTAKSLLMDYIDEIGNSSGSTSRVRTTARSDGNLFARNTDLTSFNETVDTTDEFMRKD